MTYRRLISVPAAACALILSVSLMGGTVSFAETGNEGLRDSSFGVIKDHFDWTVDGVLTRGIVSLRDFDWAGELEWVRDFEYESLLNTKEGNISYVPRYTPEMKSAHVESLRDLPWVMPSKHADENMVLGQTPGWPEEEDLPTWPYEYYESPAVPPQNIHGFTITDPEAEDDEKLQVVLVAGNHSSEMHGCWALHGMIEFLVSEDPRAETLRRKAAFHVYPLACPESRYIHTRIPTIPTLAGLPIPEGRVAEAYPLRGGPELYAYYDSLEHWSDTGAMGGRPDHNRVWDTEGLFTTIDTLVPAMKADTGGQADYLWDFHGGYPHDPGDYRGTEEAMQSPYAQALEARDAPYPEVLRRTQGGASGMTRMWATSEDGLNAHAFTFEPGQQLTKKQALVAGKNLALGFHDIVTE